MYLITKKLGNEQYYYVVKNIRLDRNTWKKITIYAGKNLAFAKLKSINKDIFEEIKRREIELRSEYIISQYKQDRVLNNDELKKLESMRVQYDATLAEISDDTKKLLFDRFMARFIYESNAIEGSKLPLKEVVKIVHHKKPSVYSERRDVQEVKNSIVAFNFINSNAFKFSHSNIIKLQKIILANTADVNFGYRKVPIIVGNSLTSKPESIRREMIQLLEWYNTSKHTEHPVRAAFEFHIRFEHIHPFEDGNGRVGRLLMNKILMGNTYPPLIVKNSNRKAYFNRFEKSTAGNPVPLKRFLLNCFKATYREFFANL
ncbi:TPA: Fic family protein [Candidatus Woesearchaeota archaeon]|nr:Fic family protein [Candidatus Woesearchaeota archaeon]